MPFQPLTLRTPIYSSLWIQTNMSWNSASNKTDQHFWASVFSSARWAASSSSEGLQGAANGSPVEKHRSLQPFGSPHHSCAKKTVIPPQAPSVMSHCQALLLPFRLWWKVTQEADIAGDHGSPASADAEECTLGGRSAGEDPRLLCLPERQFVTQAPAACGRDGTRPGS